MRPTEGGWSRRPPSTFASEGGMLMVFQDVNICLTSRRRHVIIGGKWEMDCVVLEGRGEWLTARWVLLVPESLQYGM